MEQIKKLRFPYSSNCFLIFSWSFSNLESLKLRNQLVNQKKGSCIKYVRKIFRKTNISTPLIRKRTRAYPGVRDVSFSEHFAYVLNGWLQRETSFELRK